MNFDVGGAEGEKAPLVRLIWPNDFYYKKSNFFLSTAFIFGEDQREESAEQKFPWLGWLWRRGL
jgi:hypothetical protein